MRILSIIRLTIVNRRTFFMIDLHSHILPSVDDGAQTIEDSVKMAHQARQEGITTIYATPHHLNGRYENERENVIERVATLNAEFEQRNIDLTVLPGQEIRINGDIESILEERTAMPLGDETKYILVELPSSQVPRYTKDKLFELQRMGYQPVIVHPERNSAFVKHPNILYEFVKRGTLTQLTASSVGGKFGKKIQSFCFQLIEANLVHFIASDAHNTTTRGFYMEEAYDIIGKRYGDFIVELFKESAEAVVQDELVIGNPPMEVKKKKLLGIF